MTAHPAQATFVIFDDVEVPRERLFLDGRVDLYNGIRNTAIAEVSPPTRRFGR